MSGNNNIGNYQYAAVMNSPSGTVIGNGTIVSAMYPGGVKIMRLAGSQLLNIT